MKWLFLLIVVINIAIFSWGYQREQQVQETPVAAGTDVGAMRLLSEAPGSEGTTPSITENLEPESSVETGQEQAVVEQPSTTEPEVQETDTEIAQSDESQEEPGESSSSGVEAETEKLAAAEPSENTEVAEETESEKVAEAESGENTSIAVETDAEKVVEEQPQQEVAAEEPESQEVETSPVSEEKPVSEPAIPEASSQVAKKDQVIEQSPDSELKEEKVAVDDQQVAEKSKQEEQPKKVTPAKTAKNEQKTEADKPVEPATMMAELKEFERPLADDNPVKKKTQITSRCGSIGPLKDKKVAKGILADLRKNKLDAELKQSVEKQQIGFWVVIPPLADGTQAEAKLDELTNAGLEDIWHFRGGELKNAISLGMFSKKENAENYSREVLKKGFPTKIQPRYLNRNKYLVNFNITRPKTVTRIMWRMVERKYSKMPFTEQSCAPIASRY